MRRRLVLEGVVAKFGRIHSFLRLECINKILNLFTLYHFYVKKRFRKVLFNILYLPFSLIH